ncbi:MULTISPECIES: FUSC family protein [Sporosarcina]|uniref:FUSC family protein n=1 Tax=Sporosarcina TaxID=1569 RepID=UPI00129AE412|nr:MULTISPECIES: FUSC family protein [Sporosarcina]GKV65972.1 FUSC family protein [Sporosarcina sp. NCCP-2331]GLB56028.1 FUSC family protein [Sporosarcina sp. NCCP-2378]
MKLTKKTIVTNTVLFVFIIGFVVGFGAAFGNENILIGVSTITAMLMLLERDLTSHPAGNTMKFIVLNLFIGVAAFLTGFNVWLAIPINFVAMFIISYSLLFNLKNPIYLPFSLQYVFLLAMPVAADQMPLRLASLVFGALAIMGVQMLANKNRVTKSGDKKIQVICTSLIEKVELLKKSEPHEEVSTQIASEISGLRSMIYDKREENYYLTEEGSLKLNISVALEKINLLLDAAAAEYAHHPVLTDTVQCIHLAQNSLQDKEMMVAFDELYDQVLKKYKAEHTHDLFILEMLNQIGFLRTNMHELQALGKEHYYVVKKLEQIPKKFQKLSITEKPGHTNSIKLSYAIRMALAITISGFIIDYFDMPESRWMLFTVLSVIIPLYEQSRKKMRDRIFATIIGAAAVTVSFLIVQNHTARSVLLMTAGYLMTYVKVYRYNTILVTYSAIGSVALVTGAVQVLTVERVLFVAAGVVLALLINKFVLPYKLEDANEDLWAMYEDTVQEMAVEVQDKAAGGGNAHAIKNLLLISNMIEERLKMNNQAAPERAGVAWLQHQRRIAVTLYELYGWIDRHDLQDSSIPVVTSSLEVLLNKNAGEESSSAAINKLHAAIQATPRMEERMMLTMILEAMEEMKSLRVLLQ